MNKKILTVSALSLVVAAAPVAGVFAADTTTIDETVKVTIAESCTLGAEVAAANPTETMTNGSHKEDIAGVQFAVSCNDAGGWSISAKGAGSEGKETVLTGGSGADIPTGTTLDGSQSAWAFKVSANAAGGYANMSAIPETDTKIAEKKAPDSEDQVNITYGVSISPTQGSGTYSGKVTYTLTHPAASD